MDFAYNMDFFNYMVDFINFNVIQYENNKQYLKYFYLMVQKQLQFV